MIGSAGGRLIVNGVGLETRWAGPHADRAPTIVLLHEGLGSAGLWGGFPEALAAATGYGVFAYSRAGYGGSDPCPLPRPLSYMEDEAAQVVPAVLEAIGFRRGILFGHSDGASIATIYAGSRADHRLQGLILEAPHFFVEDVSIASIARAKQEYEGGALRDRLAKHHGPNTESAFRGWNDAWLSPPFRDWNILETVGYIRVPILIVQGVDDQYGTTRQIDAAKDEAYCPVEVALLAGARHAPHAERPDDTLAAVAGFVDQIKELEGVTS